MLRVDRRVNNKATLISWKRTDPHLYITCSKGGCLFHLHYLQSTDWTSRKQKKRCGETWTLCLSFLLVPVCSSWLPNFLESAQMRRGRFRAPMDPYLQQRLLLRRWGGRMRAQKQSKRGSILTWNAGLVSQDLSKLKKVDGWLVVALVLCYKRLMNKEQNAYEILLFYFFHHQKPKTKNHKLLHHCTAPQITNHYTALLLSDTSMRVVLPHWLLCSITCTLRSELEVMDLDV